MAKLALIYGMRLLPVDDLGEVKEAMVVLKNGRTARVAMHPGGLVDRRAVLARTARAMLSGDPAQLWFLPKLVHLMDVDARVRGSIRSRALERVAGPAVWLDEA